MEEHSFDINDVINHSLNQKGELSISKMKELEGKFGRNGSHKCDVLEGPCSCGAWHHTEEMYGETVYFREEMIPISKFTKIMNKYKLHNDKGLMYYADSGIKIIYEKGKIHFSGQRKFIFEFIDNVAKDLELIIRR